MKIRFQRLTEEAIIPTRSFEDDAGLDLRATSKDVQYNVVIYGTGIAVEIPKGYVGVLVPRSSVYKKDLSLANNVGIIDSGYRGEIKVIFRYTSITPLFMYEIGDRIAQLLIIPLTQYEVEETDILETSDRGESGIGSTGDR